MVLLASILVLLITLQIQQLTYVNFVLIQLVFLVAQLIGLFATPVTAQLIGLISTAFIHAPLAITQLELIARLAIFLVSFALVLLLLAHHATQATTF